MDTDSFEDWVDRKFNSKNAKNIKSRISTIVNNEEDLDEAYNRDGCKELLEKLTYTKDDKKNNKPAKHTIKINGDIYNSTASYKAALKHFIDYKEEKKNDISKSNKENIENKSPSNKTDKTVITKKNTSKWPDWELPSDNETYELARTLVPYVKILNPLIIEAITKDNNRIKTELITNMKAQNIPYELYLWDNSPCAFPGIRRHAGSMEIAYKKKKGDWDSTQAKDFIELDDNDYPKHIWAYIFCNKKFGKKGPYGYSLAHLIDHKVSDNRMSEEFDFINGKHYTRPFFGLYTSPCNAVYVPSGLMKPTDFNGNLRNLLFQKVFQLYSDYCNLVPDYIKLKQPTDERWSIDNPVFKWSEPVGEMDNIKNFFDFREQFYREKGFLK